MTLDFGIYDRATKEKPWPSYHLPAALVELAGKHGIEIELSFYGSGRTTKANKWIRADAETARLIANPLGRTPKL
jgi:hypothetical protein